MIMKKIFILLALISLQQLSKAQCYPDRHSTNFFDGWVSCQLADNPNPIRGKSHFIMYDYGKLYALGQMKIWNSNDPSHLDWGMKDVVIDYSADGETWSEAGIYTFPQASGLSTYEGGEGPDLNGIEARYLLITGIHNYGSNDCFGLSEVKVSAEEVIVSDVENVVNLDCIDISIYPNPFTEKVNLLLTPGCSGDVQITIFDALGQVVDHQKANLSAGQQKSMELGQDLPTGTYMLWIENGGKSVQRSIVKMNRT
jgi:hypothetical protein